MLYEVITADVHVIHEIAVFLEVLGEIVGVERGAVWMLPQAFLFGRGVVAEDFLGPVGIEQILYAAYADELDSYNFV